jgi:hypothetical protein
VVQRFKSFLVHAACFAAAFVASSAAVLAVGAAFHSSSREPWLRDSPLARAVAQRCSAVVERAERRECVRAAVVLAQARDAGATQFGAAQPLDTGAR